MQILNAGFFNIVECVTILHNITQYCQYYSICTRSLLLLGLHVQIGEKIPAVRSTQLMGEIPENQAKLQFLGHNRLATGIISICYMPCLNPLSSSSSQPSPGRAAPLSKYPDSDPSESPELGTARLATVIKLVSCIGSGTRAVAAQPSPARPPGPGLSRPWPPAPCRACIQVWQLPLLGPAD